MNDVSKDAGKDDGKDVVKVSKLDDLNMTLMGVQTDLTMRALDRSRSEIEHATDFINQAAEAGVIDIGCESDGEGESGDVQDSVPDSVPDDTQAEEPPQ